MLKLTPIQLVSRIFSYIISTFLVLFTHFSPCFSPGTPKTVRVERSADQVIEFSSLVFFKDDIGFSLETINYNRTESGVILQVHTNSKVSSMFAGTQDKCVACNKKVYPIEKVIALTMLTCL